MPLSKRVPRGGAAAQHLSGNSATVHPNGNNLPNQNHAGVSTADMDDFTQLGEGVGCAAGGGKADTDSVGRGGGHRERYDNGDKSVEEEENDEEDDEDDDDGLFMAVGGGWLS